MLKSAIKSLLAHKTRMALSTLAIVLGVAFIAGTYIYTDTTNEAFGGIFDEAYVGIDVIVTGDSEFSFGQGVFFDESVAEDIAAVPGVDRVEPAIDGFGVQILDRKGEAIGGGGPPQFSGYIPESIEFAGGFELRDGRVATASGEVVIDANSAEDGDYAVGDMVAIVSQSQMAQDFELVGIVGFGEQDNLGGATFALFNLESAQNIIDQPGMITGAYVLADGGVNATALAGQIQDVLPERAKAQSAQAAAEEQALEFEEALGFFNTFLLVFAFIALFVGTFLIYNTFQFVVAQRLRELALMRAIGATRSQVVRTVLLESILIGIIGSVVGLVVGAGLALGLRAGLEAFGIELPSTSLVIQSRTIIVALVVGIIVTAISALIPAVRASRVPPVAAMREEAARPKRRSLTFRTIAGLVLLAIGIGSLLSGLLGDFDNTTASLSAIGFGALIVIIAAYVLSAIVAEPVARVLGAPLAQIQGVPGTLAQRNAGRSPRRTSATAAAIMVGVALIAMVSILNASISGTIDDVLTGDIDAEIIAQPQDTFSFVGFSPEFADEASELPEVAVTSVIKVGAVIVNDSETFLGTLDENAERIFTVDSLQGSLVPGDNGITIPIDTAENNEWTLGTEVVMTFEQTGDQAFTVEGIADSSAVDGTIIISENAYEANFAVNSDSQVYFQLTEGVSIDDGKAAIETVAATSPSIAVKTLDETAEDLKDQLNGILNLITGLLALTLIISLVGVANTMLLSIYERTREIGLLRAVGLDRTQTRRMVRSEATIISIFGAGLGVALGIFFGWAVTQALRTEGFTAFVIPWTGLIFWIVLIAVLGILFAIYPAWRASKLNVLEAISYE